MHTWAPKSQCGSTFEAQVKAIHLHIRGPFRKQRTASLGGSRSFEQELWPPPVLSGTASGRKSAGQGPKLSGGCFHRLGGLEATGHFEAIEGFGAREVSSCRGGSYPPHNLVAKGPRLKYFFPQIKSSYTTLNPNRAFLTYYISADSFCFFDNGTVERLLQCHVDSISRLVAESGKCRLMTRLQEAFVVDAWIGLRLGSARSSCRAHQCLNIARRRTCLEDNRLPCYVGSPTCMCRGSILKSNTGTFSKLLKAGVVDS